jgi:hypothetical protein
LSHTKLVVHRAPASLGASCRRTMGSEEEEEERCANFAQIVVHTAPHARRMLWTYPSSSVSHACVPNQFCVLSFVCDRSITTRPQPAATIKGNVFPLLEFKIYQHTWNNKARSAVLYPHHTRIAPRTQASSKSAFPEAGHVSTDSAPASELHTTTPFPLARARTDTPAANKVTRRNRLQRSAR